MRILSLFSGIGGLDAGFTDAGFNIVWANDFDKYAVETYRANYDNVKSLLFLPHSGIMVSWKTA